MLSEIRSDHALNRSQVLGGDAQHLGDDNNRQGKCEGVHQVEAGLSFDGVQEVVGNLFDLRLKGRDGIWG